MAILQPVTIHQSKLFVTIPLIASLSKCGSFALEVNTMSSCPCCGKPLPDTVLAGSLCSTCSDAMETGTAMDDGFQPAIRVEDFEPRKSIKGRSVTIHRPLGVTLLACLNYLAGLLLLAVAGGLLIWYKPEEDSSTRGGTVSLVLIFSLLSFIMGFGLWTLRGWGRQLALAGAALAVLLSPGGLPGIGARLFNLICFWYLLKPDIKALFEESEAPAASTTSPEQLRG